MKKFVITVLVTFVVMLLAAVAVSWKIYADNAGYQNHAASAAIRKAKQAYTLDRIGTVTPYYGTDSYQVIEAQQRGKKIYLWVPDNAKKAPFIKREVHKGITRKQAVQRLNGEHWDVKNIVSVRLGAINGNPVWEITFLNAQKQYNYVAYYFDNGKEARRILSL